MGALTVITPSNNTDQENEITIKILSQKNREGNMDKSSLLDKTGVFCGIFDESKVRVAWTTYSE